MAQEANVSLNHHKTRHHLRNTLPRNHHITLSESDITLPTPYKPGGTFIISNHRLRSRIINKITDPAGRWAGNTNKLCNDKLITCISIYQICKKPTPGEITARAQQIAWLHKTNQQLDPLHAYQIDLGQQIRGIQQKQSYILIAGDFNKQEGSTGLINMLQTEHDLVRLSCNSPQETHNQGKTCIDHALVSPALLNYINTSYYDEYPTTYYSDHRPIILSLNLLSKHPTPTADTLSTNRRLYSNNWKHVRKYLLVCKTLYKHSKILD
jgi:hypothetical protein